MKTLLKIIKNQPELKKIIHWMIIPTGEARPRLWIRLLVNPFVHKKARGSKVRWQTRMDVVPFNRFELGKNSVVEDFSTINNGVGHVIIGDGTLVGMSNVIIGPVRLGNNIIIAQNVVISGLNHNYQDINVPISKQNVSTAEIVVEDDCWIAANVIITSGVTIGKHSVLAGGSVVTKDVPAYSIVAGNPAKIIKHYDHEKKAWIKNIE
ncbi:acyltransferase [Pedobacter frigoris]|uniref:acyltransferase n=1 Tax=Pedobacter frigoris TaxID=2571272 RepID=UPI00292FB31F|nr:acyltransferase [Pedobacter frigoris]